MRSSSNEIDERQQYIASLILAGKAKWEVMMAKIMFAIGIIIQ